MSVLDAAIPGAIGLILLVWPEALFLGSSLNADPRKIRVLRGVGALLLSVAVTYAALVRFGR